MVWPSKGPQGPQVPCALRAGRQQLSAVRHAAIALRCQSPRDQRLRVCSKMGMVWPRKMEKFKGMMSWGIDTSRTRARRVAEVSRFKDCDATGSKDKVCLQEMQRTLTVSQLCSVNSSSFCLTPFHMWPPLFQLFSYHLCSSQFSKLFSTTLIFFFGSSRLSSTLFTSSPLFSTTLTSAHLFSTLLTSCHLFSTRPTSSHPRSTHLNPSHLLSTLLSSCQLFSTLLTSFHRDALHREICTHRSFYTQIFFHRQVVSQILHSKLLHRETFAHSKLLHTANFYTQQTFTQRNCYTGCAKMEKIAAKAPFATLMQLLQYGLRFSAAKQNSIPHAAAAARNHAAAIPLRSANTELQRNFRTTATEMAAPNRISTPKRKKHDFKALFKRIYSFNGISSSPKWRNICLSRVRNLHAATTIQFTSLSC